MRVKSPSSRRHRQLLKTTKGYRMTKNRLYKVAKEASLHAGQYAYIGRRLRRRDLRSLWISRINASLKSFGLKYSTFISALKSKNIALDRKILSELAIHQPDAFKTVLTTAGFKLPK